MNVKTTMGEKLKDLRVERGLTTKKLCEMTQISEAVYNGLENDSPRDTGYSRIVTLAKFFDVPTDYLLGFTESRTAGFSVGSSLTARFCGCSAN